MTDPTHRMLSDTVMRYRQLQAALGAIMVLDWQKMRRLALSQERGLVRCSDWDDLFDPRRSGRYAHWFEENFGNYPALLRQRAIDSVRYQLGADRAREPSRPRRQVTLREILIARYRSGLRVYFCPARGDGFVESDARNLIRLRLYDSSRRSWGWQNAAFAWASPQMVAPREGGEEMTPVSTTLAEIVVSSKGYSIEMHNSDDLLVEPVVVNDGV
ncbi:MAG TPA: hypothetical protein VKF35_24640 [Hyphomicrobiaceae bacterium]|nr:hypothetical protein [Hyphomicrobiaceae bacterium]